MFLEMIGHGERKSIMGEDRRSRKGSVAFVGIGTMVDPIMGGKIDGFAAVWTIAKSTMECPRKSDDEFSGILYELVYWNAPLLK